MTYLRVVSASVVASARCFVIAGGLLSTAACFVSRTEALGPGSAFSRTDRIRVTRVDGSSAAIVGPRLVNDSVVGIWAGSSQRIAVALSEVRTVTVRRLSADRTVLTIIGVAAGAAVLGKAIKDEASKPWDICPNGCVSDVVP